MAAGSRRPNRTCKRAAFARTVLAEFNEATGIDATEPAVILERLSSREWTPHKCERIAAYAARYAGIVRAHVPECVIGAYMCPWTSGRVRGRVDTHLCAGL